MSNTVKNCFLIETFLYENILRTPNFFVLNVPVCAMNACLFLVATSNPDVNYLSTIDFWKMLLQVPTHKHM